MRYTDRLKAMNLSSIQRCFDRYRILYARKAIRGEVPDFGIKLNDRENARNGIKMIVPDKRKMKALRSDSLYVRGPELWNCLPIDIREISQSKLTFKKKLDKFLKLIPDIPRIDGHCLDSNILDHRVNQWMWTMR